jgi:hypothetical protein
MKIELEKNKRQQLLTRLIFILILPWALSSCSLTPLRREGVPIATEQALKEGSTLNSGEVAKVEQSDLVSFDGVSIELAESGEASVVFEGILVTSSEVPRSFGARERHVIPEADFRPKCLKSLKRSDQSWMLVEIRSQLFWVIK